VDDPVSWLGLTRCPSGPYKRSSEDAPTRTPVANHLITPAAIAIAPTEIDDRYRRTIVTTATGPKDQMPGPASIDFFLIEGEIISDLSIGNARVRCVTWSSAFIIPVRSPRFRVRSAKRQKEREREREREARHNSRSLAIRGERKGVLETGDVDQRVFGFLKSNYLAPSWGTELVAINTFVRARADIFVTVPRLLP
jgi:hypothetical protein